MSYHVHNLERGDCFSAPADLTAYADYTYDKDEPFYRWKVTRCTPIEDTGDYRVKARCIKAEDGIKVGSMDQVVSGDISLCMVMHEESYRDPLLFRIRRALRLRLPRLYQFLNPEARPGRMALRKAIWMAGPGGQLVRALECGSYSPALIRGEVLNVESLESVMRAVTFDSTKIKLRT